MPGRFVIATDGTIVYAEVNPDYTHRPDPEAMLPLTADSLSTFARLRAILLIQPGG
jgi:hypothetical protein